MDVISKTTIIIGRAVSSLSDIDKEGFSQVLFECGLTLNQPDFFEKFKAKVSEANKLDDEIFAFLKEKDNLEAIKKLISIIGQVKSLVEGINEVSTQIKDVSAKTDFPIRLFDYLIVKQVENNYPKLYAILSLLGIISFYENVNTQNIRRIVWSRFLLLLTNPIQVANEEYGWGDDFNISKFFRKLERLLGAFYIPGGLYRKHPSQLELLSENEDENQEIRLPIARYGKWPEEAYNELGISIGSNHDSSSESGIMISPYVVGNISETINLGNDWKLNFKAGASLNQGVGIVITPPADIDFKYNLFSEGDSDSDFNIALTLQQKEPIKKLWLFGSEDSTGFSLSDFCFSVNFTKEKTTEIILKFDIKDIELLITKGDGDGFIQKILPDEAIRVKFDLGILYSTLTGFEFNGSGRLSLIFNIDKQLGPVFISTLYVETSLSDSSINLNTSVSLGLLLGPLEASVSKIGVNTSLQLGKSGLLGSGADLSFGFKAPEGIGLAINSYGFSGGGFLNFDTVNERYSGAFKLDVFNSFGIDVLGLLTTKMPNGSSGFSLLLMLSASFSPGVQLGYGFFLTKVGGLLGLNRTMNLEALRLGVKDNTLENILFPTDIIANADQIINSLETVFPTKQDRFVFGPMARIEWGSPGIVKIDLGFIIEVPAPVRIAILGVLRSLLPTEEVPLIKLQVNFLGIIDFENEYLSFDASLYDSKLLSYDLAGDMALRVYWGSEPNFLLSVGGFHPGYVLPPIAPPGMKRLSIVMGWQPKLTLQAYFAITSNTAQIGAKVEFYLGIDEFNVYGFLEFNALFQFNPFYFTTQIEGGLAVRIGDEPLIGIHLRFQLSGPNPWRAVGSVSFTIFWFLEISSDFDTQWGDSVQELPTGAFDSITALKEALDDVHNWTAVLPSTNSLMVVLRDLAEDDSAKGAIILQPAGSLIVTQKVLPVETYINRYGNQTLGYKNKSGTLISLADDNYKFKYSVPGFSATNINDFFAPGQFFNLKDEEKLSRPSFERLPCGYHFQQNELLKGGKSVSRVIEYEVFLIVGPDGSAKLPGTQKQSIYSYKYLLRGTEVSRHAQTLKRAGIEPLVPIGSNGYFKDIHENEPPDHWLNGQTMDRLRFKDLYKIVEVDYLKPVGDYKFESQFEANRFLENLINNGSHQQGSLVVVSESELD